MTEEVLPSYDLLIHAVDYFLGHMEVLFLHEAKLRSEPFF